MAVQGLWRRLWQLWYIQNMYLCSPKYVIMNILMFRNGDLLLGYIKAAVRVANLASPSTVFLFWLCRYCFGWTYGDCASQCSWYMGECCLYNTACLPAFLDTGFFHAVPQGEPHISISTAHSGDCKKNILFSICRMLIQTRSTTFVRFWTARSLIYVILHRLSLEWQIFRSVFRVMVNGIFIGIRGLELKSI